MKRANQRPLVSTHEADRGGPSRLGFAGRHEQAGHLGRIAERAQDDGLAPDRREVAGRHVGQIPQIGREAGRPGAPKRIPEPPLPRPKSFRKNVGWEAATRPRRSASADRTEATSAEKSIEMGHSGPSADMARSWRPGQEAALDHPEDPDNASRRFFALSNDLISASRLKA